jgi:uncharacterized tellurite resistance protein B-like protein
MLKLIKSALGIAPRGSAAPRGGPDRARLAAAVLLVEAAHADYHCSAEEVDHVVQTIQRLWADVPEEYARELVEVAHAERERAVDVYEFTRSVNEGMTPDEKRAVLRAVWSVIRADGVIDKYEEHLARRLTQLLRLEHKDYIAAKHGEQ